MYVNNESRWIDPSWRRLTGDFIRPNEERFNPIEGQASLLQNYAFLSDPTSTTEKILAHCPDAKTQLLNTQDMPHFPLCSNGMATSLIPFIPSLEQNFEF